MDRLSSDQQELLRKNSTERLRLKLTRVGWEEDSVFAMDRTELLRAAADAEAMAEQASISVKEPLPVDDGSATTSPASNAVRLRELELEERRMVREDRKLELEMKRLEVEVEGRKAQAQVEKRKAQTQVEERKAQAEERKAQAQAEAEEREREQKLELARLEIQRQQVEADRDVRIQELQAQANAGAGDEQREQAVVDARGVIPWLGGPKYLGTHYGMFCPVV